MDFESGYGFAIVGSCVYGTLICALRLFGETPTSEPVRVVCTLIAVIFYLIALIKVIIENHDSFGELMGSLIKLAILIGITYWLISRLALASMITMIIYVIISWILTPIIIIIL